MNTAAAFAMGEANRGNEQKVFDWDRAAEIILRSECLEAAAGLAGDWEWTGGPILRGGKPVPRGETYTFLASTWATPELEVGGVLHDCYRMASQVPPEWGDDHAKVYWPESALRILRGQVLEATYERGPERSGDNNAYWQKTGGCYGRHRKP